jgi:hypothetical protein
MPLHTSQELFDGQLWGNPYAGQNHTQGIFDDICLKYDLASLLQ